MYILYGIPNCDTMKKARSWLSEAQIDYQFHDYKKLGASLELLHRWDQQLGWEKLINRSGTTWRKLPEEARENLMTTSALQLMHENPSLIKRPVLCDGQRLLVGFTADSYRAFFS